MGHWSTPVSRGNMFEMHVHHSFLSLYLHTVFAIPHKHRVLVALLCVRVQ